MEASGTCGWFSMPADIHLNTQCREWTSYSSKSSGRSSHMRSRRAKGTNILSFSEL